MDNENAIEAGASAPASSIPAEEWRGVVGYERRYEVSDQGRVRSWVKWHRYGGLTDEPRIKSQTTDRKGYMRVKLSDGLTPEKTHSTSTLVMAAFVGARPEGMEVCHNDGNPSNNRLDNLRYDTPRGNAADKLLHGTNNHGSRHGISKLTEEIVLEIYHMDAPQDDIAEKFGVSQSRVSSIKRGKTWTYLGLEPKPKWQSTRGGDFRRDIRARPA